MQTVYADVLVILNTYVNFALLRLTGLIDRRNVGRLRIFLAALLGGLYSLIILCDGLSNVVVFLSRTAVSALMVLLAFGFGCVRKYLRDFAVFFGVSFIFAGLMLALWLFAAPKGMIFNNGTVYFRFDTITLLTMTAVSYAVVRLIFLFGEKKTSKGRIYDLSIKIGDCQISCSALSDSGSSLRDWYSSEPVILICPTLIEKLPEELLKNETKTRVIPVKTAGGETLIKIFKPDSIHIKGIDFENETKGAYIGISKAPLTNGEFRAVIPHEMTEKEKEKC